MPEAPSFRFSGQGVFSVASPSAYPFRKILASASQALRRRSCGGAARPNPFFPPIRGDSVVYDVFFP